MSLTLDRLKEALSYDAGSGLFVWRRPPRQRRIASPYAGTLNPNGYVQICLDQTIYKAHRLAWFYHYGEWPIGEIDHADGARNNNAIANLRLASKSTNQANAKKRTGTKTQYKGVVRMSGNRRKPWMARLTVNRETVELGYYASPEEAHAVYLTAAKKHFGDFARAK